MTLVDSADSVLMLYAYADFPEQGFAIFERRDSSGGSAQSSKSSRTELAVPSSSIHQQMDIATPASPIQKHIISSQPNLPDLERNISNTGTVSGEGPDELHNGVSATQKKTLEQAAKNTMSGLSILLTSLSILVAFR
jgi:high-affinity nickel-transport protein